MDKILLKDLIIEVEAIPYIILYQKYKNKVTRLTRIKNKKMKTLLNKRLKTKKLPQNVDQILGWDFNISDYKFSFNKITMTLKPGSKYHLQGFPFMWDKKKRFDFDKIEKNKKYNRKDLEIIVKEQIQEVWGKDGNNLIPSAAPDLWMSGDIIIIEEGEIDDEFREFGIAISKIKFKQPKGKKGKKLKIRKSPAESATLFKVNTIKKGQDGNKYTIKENKNGVKRWVKVN